MCFSRLLIGGVLTFILCFSCFAAENKFEYDSKGARDPFVPLISEEGGVVVSDAYNIGSFGEIRLEGIIWDSSGSSVALINGELVREGDALGEARVLKIEKDNVRLSIGGEEITIKLLDE